ncbi:fibronectin type III domain-containing protein [Geomonas subterranea]|uniref:fibronectin type III domain-containing protein n=1 Tax=Geomonas subterranea TaxID=2847989 RepID=UPI001CD80BC6|nr:fibronectin type III domain-containing protein [Geomonas fuzhouensis]
MSLLHPLLDIVDVNVRDMSHVELGNFAINLADAFARHKEFQGEGALPKPLCQLDELRGLGVSHLAVTKEAESGNRFKKVERDASRPMVELHTTMLINWAAYRSVTENKPTLISELDLPPKMKASKGALHIEVTAPQNPKAKHGKSGVALITVNRVPGAMAYYVGICKGDPSLPESWSTVGPFHKSRNMELTGLEPGQLYYFKAYCSGPSGQSEWSSIISLRIL